MAANLDRQRFSVHHARFDGQMIVAFRKFCEDFCRRHRIIMSESHSARPFEVLLDHRQVRVLRSPDQQGVFNHPVFDLLFRQLPAKIGDGRDIEPFVIRYDDNFRFEEFVPDFFNNSANSLKPRRLAHASGRAHGAPAALGSAPFSISVRASSIWPRRDAHPRGVD